MRATIGSIGSVTLPRDALRYPRDVNDPRTTRAEARSAALDLLTDRRATRIAVHAATELGDAPDPKASPDPDEIGAACFEVVALRADEPGPPATFRLVVELDARARIDGLWGALEAGRVDAGALVAALRAIGAPGHAAVVARAAALFAETDPDPDRYEAVENDYVSLDASEPLAPRLVAFGEAHADAFFLDPAP